MGVRRNIHKNCFRKSKENRPLAGSRSAHKITLICILKHKAGGRGFVFGQAAVPRFSNRTISDRIWSQAQSCHCEAPIKPLSTSVCTQVWNSELLKREFSCYLLLKKFHDIHYWEILRNVTKLRLLSITSDTPQGHFTFRHSRFSTCISSVILKTGR
jgi:hypothetical protein